MHLENNFITQIVIMKGKKHNFFSHANELYQC